LNLPLAQLDFPRDAVIGAVLKQGRVETPRGESGRIPGLTLADEQIP